MHHIRYPKRLGTEAPEDLVATCRRCHRLAHDGGEVDYSNSMTLTFEGRQFIGVPVGDGVKRTMVFVWDEVDRVLFADERHLLVSARHSRRKYKEQMREGRHFGERDGKDWLSYVGIIRYAQIIDRTGMPDDGRIWRFSDYIEDIVDKFRRGELAVIPQTKGAERALLKLHEVMQDLAIEQIEHGHHLADHRQRIEALEGAAGSPSLLTVVARCSILGVSQLSREQAGEVGRECRRLMVERGDNPDDARLRRVPDGTGVTGKQWPVDVIDSALRRLGWIQ